MARARGSGSGMAVALVVVSLLGVAFMIWAIMLFQEREKLVNAEQAATADLAKFIKAADRNQPWVQALTVNDPKDPTRPKGTVVEKLQGELASLRNLINGDESMEAQVLKDNLKRHLESIGWEPGTTLVSQIDRLKTSQSKDREQIKKLTEEAEQLRDELVKLRTTAKQSADQYRTSTGQLQTGLKTEQDSHGAFKGEATGQFKKLEDRLTEVQSTKQQTENDLQSKIEQLNTEIASLKEQIRKLRKPEKPNDRIKAPDPSRMSDGLIASVLPDEGLVYIDKGQEHRIVLGLTFEVYDRKIGIVPDALGEFRGKATIEVINVSDNSSVARVVRKTPNQQVLDGDLIANAVYDPNKAYKFHVYGDFDIESIGRAGPDDRRRVEMMIRQWGGKVASNADQTVDEDSAAQEERKALAALVKGVETKLASGPLSEAREMLTQGVERLAKTRFDRPNTILSYDVDFLVLGIEPELPERPDDKADDVTLAKYRAMVTKFEMYKTLEEEAKDLGIPVLNQSRFLALVGYYRRGQEVTRPVFKAPPEPITGSPSGPPTGGGGAGK